MSITARTICYLQHYWRRIGRSALVPDELTALTSASIVAFSKSTERNELDYLCVSS